MVTAADLWQRWDGFVADKVFTAFETLFNGGEDIRSSPSPVTKDWPAVSSPTVLVTWALLSLAVVGLGLALITPAEKRKSAPQSAALNTFVNYHNAWLIVLSAFMFASSCYQAYVNEYKFWGQAYNAREVGMAKVIYIFYVSKLYEYLDTYIMLLKGNLKQVSFLHVYHHLSISLIWWAIAYSAPGGDAWYSAALNSLVHVVMYMYYYLMGKSSADPTFRKKYLWWGKYLTSFQMTQFVSMLAQGVYTYLYSDYPKWISKFLVVYMMTLLVLFLNFFVGKYFGTAGKAKVE